MIKHVITLILFLTCMLSFSFAQEPHDQTVIKHKTKKKIPPPPMVTVAFISSDTCYITINGEKEKKIIKEEPTRIKLPLKYNRLFFESDETGEIIRSLFLDLKDTTHAPRVFRVNFTKRSPGQGKNTLRNTQTTGGAFLLYMNRNGSGEASPYYQNGYSSVSDLNVTIPNRFHGRITHGFLLEVPREKT